MLNFWKPPIFEDENKTNQARLLNIILWALVCMPIPYVLYSVVATPQETGAVLVQAVVGETANLFLLFLLNRGQVRLASILQVTLFWLFFNMVAFTGNGIRGPSFTLGLGLVVVIAGVLLGGWGATLFTIASLLSGLAMAILEIKNPRAFAAPANPLNYWVIALLVFPVGALLQNLAAHSIQQALHKSRASEASVQQREAILQAVAFSAERFFGTTDWTNEIDLVLERLGKVLNVSHAYLFQLYTNNAGVLCSSMKYEWCAPGFPSELDREIFQDNPVPEPGFDKSYDMFNAGQLYIIRQPADAQSPEELDYLHEIGVKALIDIPLTVNGKWWGTLGFDDCISTRDWSNAEIDALKVAGNVVSAAIQRKLAEAALRASENRLRLALESAHIGIWDWDIVNNSIAWLDKVESIFGLAPGTFDGKYDTYLGLIHPDDIAGVQTAINAALAGETESYFIEHRIITATGQLRWLEGKGEVYRAEQGQPIRMIGTVIDITGRKQNEQAQQATYRIAQAAFDTKDLNTLYRSIHNILKELMPAQNLLIVSYDPANDLFNISYQRDEYDQDTAPYRPGKGLCAYVLRTGQPLLITPELFQEMERSGQVEIISHRMIDWLGVPLRTQRGIIGVMAIQTYSTDIRLNTEHKDLLMFVSTQIAAAIERQQSLSDIQRFSLQLEQRVRERTTQLESANRELESFSYSVSHDLRAPLRAIRGYSQIIMSDYGAQLPEEGREQLGKVIEGTQQMNELIEALLSISRMSRSELRKSQLDLTTLARTITQSLAQNDAGRTVTYLISEGLSAYADEKLIGIVLQNLFGNAWKYTARATEARIEFGMQPRDGENIYFVRDNGIGFDMKYSDKLFGAFQRLHPVDEFPGHGIGLATVQRIIIRHGGRVWAEGAPNAGATFYFSLPTNQE